MKERIRAIMESKGMTQQEFSQFLEMSPASLSSIFTGRTNPTLNVVESIKKKFDNINLEWLMFGRGSMFSASEDAEDSNVEDGPENANPELSETQNSSYPISETQYRSNNLNEGTRAFAGRDNSRGTSYNTEKPTFSDMKILNNSRRKIKEIRVFYDDQTYESFVPKE